jgi:uncharacterized protein involved in cysteine biosynthesis
MLSAQDRVDRGVNILTFSGAGLGFLAYLVLGVIPGLLYGGYAGLFMAGAMFGTPVESTLVVKGITFGGILLGGLASLFIFLVAGAFLGSVTALIARPFLWIHARHIEAAERAALAAVSQEKMEVPIRSETTPLEREARAAMSEDFQVNA